MAEETAIPQSRLSFKHVGEDLSPAIERIQTEDEQIAGLDGTNSWKALRDRIQRKIEAAESSAKVTSNTVGLIDDMALFGFRCAAKDLLVEGYQSIIDDVELTAKLLKAKEDERIQETTKE